MSDEKPLVTVEPSDALGFELRVAGRFVCADADRASLDSIAHAATAAVEQREARLVAALRLAKDHVNHAYHCSGVDSCDCGADDAVMTAYAALAGKGDYVPRAELEAERERTRGLWAVLNDVVHEGGLASERAAECMRALGMRPAMTDDEVIAEVNRRGLARKIVAAGMSGAAAAVAPHEPGFARQIRELAERMNYRACPHCNNMPYIAGNAYIAGNGANVACPECGIYRPLVTVSTRTD